MWSRIGQAWEQAIQGREGGCIIVLSGTVGVEWAHYFNKEARSMACLELKGPFDCFVAYVLWEEGSKQLFISVTVSDPSSYSFL